MNYKILGTAVVALVAVSAFAQESKPVGLSVRAGVFFPSNGDTKTATSKTWFVGGLDYKLPNIGGLGTMGAGKAGGSEFNLSVDYFQKGDFRSVPVLVNWVGGQNEVFYSVGAGLGFNKLPDGNGGTSSKSAFAYAVAVGYNFQQGKSPIFVEARYYGSSKSQLNGFGLEAGIHF